MLTNFIVLCNVKRLENGLERDLFDADLIFTFWKIRWGSEITKQVLIESVCVLDVSAILVGELKRFQYFQKKNIVSDITSMMKYLILFGVNAHQVSVNVEYDRFESGHICFNVK